VVTLHHRHVVDGVDRILDRAEPKLVQKLEGHDLDVPVDTRDANKDIDVMFYRIREGAY
jgi:hypothetical protein